MTDQGPDPDDIDTAALAEDVTVQAYRVLAHSVARESEPIADILETISERWGGFGIYALCCTLAETIRAIAYPHHPRGDGTLNGPMMGLTLIGDAENHPNNVWAARFTVAYINGDHDNCSALFADEIRNHDDMGGIAELIGVAGHMTRALTE